MRVYPPWSEPGNYTAQATQRWQVAYFTRASLLPGRPDPLLHPAIPPTLL
ncbi:MepB family protein [Arthrobacter pascens]